MLFTNIYSSAGKEVCLQCRRPWFNPWVGKIPWRRERLPTPVFWPGEFRGLYSPWGRRVRHNWVTFHFHFSPLSLNSHFYLLLYTDDLTFCSTENKRKEEKKKRSRIYITTPTHSLTSNLCGLACFQNFNVSTSALFPRPCSHDLSTLPPCFSLSPASVFCYPLRIPINIHTRYFPIYKKKKIKLLLTLLSESTSTPFHSYRYFKSSFPILSPPFLYLH